jgi:fructose-specific phosphotransferase system IIC component
VKEALIDLRRHLLSGVSYSIPFIACGGILIATAIGLNTRFSPSAPGDIDGLAHPILKLLLDIGVAAFTLMPAILAGYIAVSMAGRPGLVPGAVGGWLANHISTFVDGTPTEVSAGFLGAMVAGLLAGWVVNLIKKVQVPKPIRPIMPILILPIVGSLIVGTAMLTVIGIPIANLMGWLADWLQAMSTGNQVVLAMILGAMIAFDMGGPVNKTAFFFGSAMLTKGNYAVMGAVAAAICTPPLGLGLATLLARRRWTQEEREAGAAALTMGMIGITEGAIPFAASDPIRVIPTIVIGSATAAVIAMLAGVGNHAPHGGPIVLPVIDNKLLYILAIVVGTLVTALLINAIKAFTAKPLPDPAATERTA